MGPTLNLIMMFVDQKAKHGSTTQDLTPQSYSTKNAIASAPSSPRRSTHQILPPQELAPRVPPVNDKTQFFDRVKRALDNRDLYNEFLKLANLFAQDYIDTARLVKESRNFLGNTELYTQFREILGWDEKKEREHFLSEQHTQSNWAKPAIAGLPERPGRIDLGEKYGSYRQVSATVRGTVIPPFDDFLTFFSSYVFSAIFHRSRMRTCPVQDETTCADLS